MMAFIVKILTGIIFHLYDGGCMSGYGCVGMCRYVV
jgi:hypothetical protein